MLSYLVKTNIAITEIKDLFRSWASRAFLPSLKVVPLECGTPAV